jgi:hypothetical protein
MNISFEINHRYTNPKMNYENRQQLAEISDVKWMTLSELKVHDTAGYTYSFTKSILQVLKKSYKLKNISIYNTLVNKT